MNKLYQILAAALLLLCVFSASGLAESGNILELPLDITVIDDEAFEGVSAFEVVLPEGTRIIGKRAFAQSDVKIIHLPAGIESIADDAFEDCAGVRAIYTDGTYAAGWCEANGIERYRIPTDTGDFEYEIFADANGVMTVNISRYTGTDTDVVIPEYIDGAIVKYMEGDVFRDNTTVKNVYIPDNVIYVYYRAFYGCTALETLSAPVDSQYYFAGLTNLRDVHLRARPESASFYSLSSSIFSGCTALETVRLEQISSIPSNAFKDCVNLKNVSFSGEVRTIGSYAFSGCVSLCGIELHDELRQIGEGAFMGCTGLTEVTLSGRTSTVGKNAFSGCSNLEKVIFMYDASVSEGAFDGCGKLTVTVLPGGRTETWCKNNGIAYNTHEYDFDVLIAGGEINSTIEGYYIQLGKYCGTDTEVVVPEYIGRYPVKVLYTTFKENTSITSVTLPDGLVEIGVSAFSKCTDLKSVNLPEGLRTINSEAFYLCESLTEMDIPDTVTSLGGSVFVGCESISRIVVPTGVTEIKYGVFRECTGLEELVLPEGIVSIGERAFDECSGLTELLIPETVVSIGSYAFYKCTGLSEIILPETVESIGAYAFSGCTGIAEMTLPSKLTVLGEYTFEDCTALRNVMLPEGLVTIGKYAFDSCAALEYADIPEGVKEIGAYAFYGCSSLRRGYIPDAVTEVPDGMFMNCKVLEEARIHEGIVSIGKKAFYACEVLEGIWIPGKVTSIGESAFYGCKAVESFIIPAGVEDIPYGAFSNCTSLRSVNIPEGVVAIGDFAFNSCALGEIDLPKTVQTIGKAAFQSNYEIAEVCLPESVTTIGKSAFAVCRNLRSVYIPDGVTEIGEEAFRYCYELTYVRLPGTITVLPRNFAYDSEKLTSLTVPEGVTTIADYALPRYGLKSLYLPKTLTSITNNQYIYDATVYCWQYSYAESWANSSNCAGVVLMDDKTAADITSVKLTIRQTVPVGKTVLMSASIFPVFDENEITWSSSAPEIITVDANGRMTGMSSGTADITLTVNGVSDTVSVTAYKAVETFELSENEITVQAGQTYQLGIASMTPADAEETLVWKSENANYASVNSSGLVTAKAVGDVVITVTSASGVSRTCLVHVVYPT